MNKKDIFLDFTSLLDVTLIIIFYFVIFSHFETIENREKTEEKLAEYEIAAEAAGLREQEAAALKDQAEKELSILREADPRRAEDMEAILQFLDGNNVKMIMKMEHNGWYLKILDDQKEAARIIASDDLADDLREVLNALGYVSEDTLFCDLIFDGSEPGTAPAYRRSLAFWKRSVLITAIFITPKQIYR